MEDVLTPDRGMEVISKLTHFKEYAVSHPQLVQVDQVLMRAIREPAGFAHVLVYGPSGVGKTTMIRQITRRFQEMQSASRTSMPNYGTYELLNFRNLSGQASRRGLDLHFPRYLFQHEQDCQDFQGVLLALLKQVPLSTDIPALMQHWFYFYERSIGCVGVLKDWLIRAVAAALHDGNDTLTLERLEEHALSLSQCERMALDSIEGEQKLGYADSRREHLWRLLQAGMASTTVPSPVASTVVNAQSQSITPDAPLPAKKQRKKRSSSPKTEPVPQSVEILTDFSEPSSVSVPPKGRRSKKTKEAPLTSIEMIKETDNLADASKTETPKREPLASQKKPSRRVGQRKPQRDPVG